MITYANDKSDAYYARRSALRKKNVSLGKVRRSLKYSNLLKGLNQDRDKFEVTFAGFQVFFRKLNDEEVRELLLRDFKIWP